MNRLRVVELFCGIGGCAAALDGAAEVVAAVDINRQALAIYRDNFPHPIAVRAIESLPADQLATWRADLWWLSPPCQPYTVRGRKRDLNDPRASSLVTIIEAIRAVCPSYIALENVPGFAASRAHELLRTTLDGCGYGVQEIVLCPTDLGVPNRRRRFYLLASRADLSAWTPLTCPVQSAFSLSDILEPNAPADLDVPPELIAAYTGAVHVVDANDSQAVTCCFTSGYGKSITCSGSFLKTARGYRRFSPAEIVRLLCFPKHYRLATDRPLRRLWPLVGNSLSVAAVRYVLSAVPELRGAMMDNG